MKISEKIHLCCLKRVVKKENSTASNISKESTSLSHSCLRVPQDVVVWIDNIFDNNLRMENDFTEYLKKSCRVRFDLHLFHEIFIKIC